LVGWGDQSNALYTCQIGVPNKLFKIDLATGRREFWKALLPANPTGLLFLSLPQLAPDAKAYGYTYFRVLSALYLVDVAN
jgi:hypothetical protein